MRKVHTQMHFLPADNSAARRFRTGISLHSHTEHSREGLEDLPRYINRMPVVSQFFQREMRRYRDRMGEWPDFSKAYWRGPLSARAAYALEQRQIQNLGLGAIVSLTDHDNLDACLLLNADNPSRPVPISVEWTVPYQESYLHLGIHNVPRASALAWMTATSAYTRKPRS